MPGTKDVKMIGLVMVGVFFAGYVMNMFRSNDIVSSAIDGFDG